jgi:hypothetical protein
VTSSFAGSILRIPDDRRERRYYKTICFQSEQQTAHTQVLPTIVIVRGPVNTAIGTFNPPIPLLFAIAKGRAHKDNLIRSRMKLEHSVSIGGNRIHPSILVQDTTMIEPSRLGTALLFDCRFSKDVDLIRSGINFLKGRCIARQRKTNTGRILLTRRNGDTSEPFEVSCKLGSYPIHRPRFYVNPKNAAGSPRNSENVLSTGRFHAPQVLVLAAHHSVFVRRCQEFQHGVAGFAG